MRCSGCFGPPGGGGGGGGGRRGAAANRPSRGADLQYHLVIDLSEAVKGFERELELTHPTPCSFCGGSGAEPGSRPVPCSSCGGAGQVRHRQGFLVVATVCPACRGEGTTLSDPCKECDGAGNKEVDRSVPVEVPAGVDTGVRLRIPGEGQPGRLGGPTGDLYVLIEVEPHPVFERDGRDLHCEVEVPFFLAVLGGVVTVPTLDEEEPLEVPGGTQPGARLSLRGRGAPSLRGDRRGDQVCHVRVKIPRRLKRRQRELLEEYAREAGYDPGEARKPGFFERLVGGE